MWLVLLGLPKQHSALPEFKQAFSLYAQVGMGTGVNWKSHRTHNDFSHLGKQFIEVVEQHQHIFSDSKEGKASMSCH